MIRRFVACLPMLLGALVLASAAAAQQAPAAASSAAPKPPAFADVRRQQPISGDAKAGAGKATVCGACHGPQGISIAPNFPNLAGQSATYLYVQLKQFKQGQRNDPIMSGQAATLSDADMRDLASYYASLAPKPAGPADESSAGARLYLAGDPARGIPPCQGCHGVDAMGPRPEPDGKPSPPWATFPHLRGQSSLYVGKALGDFRSGARAESSNARIMQGVAQTLGDDDVQALGAYLSTR